MRTKMRAVYATCGHVVALSPSYQPVSSVEPRPLCDRCAEKAKGKGGKCAE